MFDIDDDKVFFSWCSAVLAVLGGGASTIAWIRGVPGATQLSALFLFVFLMVFLFIAANRIGALIAWFFPPAVLLAYCIYLPVLDWLAGIRDSDAIPPQRYVVWYGAEWVQLLIGFLIILLGYLWLWKIKKIHFPT